MRSESELALQLDVAVDRLLWGDAIVAVEEDTPRELIPFVETFAALLELTREPARPEFRQALRARFIGEGPAVARTDSGPALLGRVAAVVAATFVVGAAINPALARNLVQSVSDTMGAEIAAVVQEVLDRVPSAGTAPAISPEGVTTNGFSDLSLSIPEGILDSAPAVAERSSDPIPEAAGTLVPAAYPAPVRQSAPPQFSGGGAAPGGGTAPARATPDAPAAPPAHAPVGGAVEQGASVPGLEGNLAEDAPPPPTATDQGSHTGDLPASDDGDSVTVSEDDTSQPGQGSNPPGTADNPHANHPPTSQGTNPPGNASNEGQAADPPSSPGNPANVAPGKPGDAGPPANNGESKGTVAASAAEAAELRASDAGQHRAPKPFQEKNS